MSGAGGTVNEYRLEGDDGPETDLDLGGGDTATADHVGPVGDDSPPLDGDFVVAVELDGETETLAAVGYSDDTTKTAEPGEKRIYARDSDGALTAEIHIKGDGSVNITQVSGSTIVIASDGKITATAGTIDLKASTLVLLADGADDFAVRGLDLITFLNSSIFPTAMGPTGTVVVPATPATFNSTKVKLK